METDVQENRQGWEQKMEQKNGVIFQHAFSPLAKVAAKKAELKKTAGLKSPEVNLQRKTDQLTRWWQRKRGWKQ